MKKILTIVSAVICLVFTSCKKDVPVLEVSQTDVQFTSGLGNVVVDVTANHEWQATCSEKWVVLTFDPTGTTLKISVQKNTDTDDRTAVVEVSSSALRVEINVTQAQKNTITISGKTILQISGEAQTIDVDLSSNINYEIKPSVDWITVKESKAMTSSHVVLAIADNPLSIQRNGFVSFKNPSGDGSADLMIYQAGRSASILVTVEGLSEYIVPFVYGSGFSAEVNWGDNTDNQEYKKDLSHTFATEGSHVVEIKGAGATNVDFSNLIGIKKIDLTEIL